MATLTDLMQVIEKHWGYRSLRALQEPAMRAMLDGRDSLVVLPTGGGKSLCYQAPALVRGGTTVVVSPLILLMKDQVDSLRACGVAAAQLDSSMSATERFCTEVDLREGKLPLLFVAPERLVAPEFIGLLQRLNVPAFAIDEAHCISHWGHDFRPEYRQMNRLKELFPKASVHGFTATATQRVRTDICAQLALHQPEVLVGNFDRPNLNYRVLPRQDLGGQIMEVLERHKGEAGIIYCIRRRDVDDVAALLKAKGLNALPYHAGMEPVHRRQVQDAFAAETCDLIVATVAFGMGIDRSNIRFILHAAMPKSIEHYQQETGRGGRDGLEAECVLLYSGQDYRTWEFILQKSFQENQADPEQLAAALKHVRDMENYCRQAVCRHRSLVSYFGQSYGKPNCAACDLCLGDTEPVPDALIVAQILSCVARVKGNFGVGHIVSVLCGDNTEKVRRLGHDKLSTYGLMADMPKPELRTLIFQLINQEVLVQQDVALPSGMTVQILALNAASWEVMRGQRPVRLHRLVKKSKEEFRSTAADRESWEGVDRPLFEKLRELRRELAEQRDVPAYVIFSDKTLRDLARYRPSTTERMRFIYGVGETKLNEFGQRFLATMDEYCNANNSARDVPFAAAPPPPSAPRIQTVTATKALALEMFRGGATLAQVMAKTGRARSTACEYLCDHIRQHKIKDISAWIAPDAYARIADAARKAGTDRLKPIFVLLQEKVPYEDIRVVVTHMMLEAESG